MLIWIIIISLLLIGLALIIVELVFIPGTTVVGLLGAGFSIAGIILCYQTFGETIGFYVLIGMLAVTLTALVLSVRSGAWSRFSLKSAIGSKVNEGMLLNVQVGDEGLTVSNLRPSGKAEFNQRTFEVKTSGNFVESGAKVRITQIDSNQIIVEPLKS